MTLIYHGTPLTPVAALRALAGRSFCVSHFRPDSLTTAEAIASNLMLDNGAFSHWMAARREGKEWANERGWTAYYSWLEPRIDRATLAIIPDMPGAPSQLNDGLLNDWPFRPDQGTPLFHMDGPLTRLGRLCERYPVVALGWVGETRATNRVGSPEFRARMDEIAQFMGNTWHPLHMMRGVAVAQEWPFLSADSTSLAQNGWKYDREGEACQERPWSGRNIYADKLEGIVNDATISLRPDKRVQQRRVQRLEELRKGTLGERLLSGPDGEGLSRAGS